MKKGGSLSFCDPPADSAVEGPLERREISEEDHPLSLGKASVWHQFFQHTEITEQIDRDLERTHPDLKFFSGDSSFSKKHREALKNILVLFAKLNPEIRYVQGMNEVKPQYYAFSWITLLLTQEFEFQSIMIIWDSLLGNPYGVQDMLLKICCAMLLCVKNRLLGGDFVANLKLLQHYPDINIEHLLQVARDISSDPSSYRMSLSL